MLIGDTVTDIQAATAAGVRSIGHANKPDKANVLNDAGADAVATTMDEIASALVRERRSAGHTPRCSLLGLVVRDRPDVLR